MSEWQPISTAPRMRRILLGAPAGAQVQYSSMSLPIRHVEGVVHEGMVRINPGTFEEQVETTAGEVMVGITHWMPLPEPPRDG